MGMHIYLCRGESYKGDGNVRESYPVRKEERGVAN